MKQTLPRLRPIALPLMTCLMLSACGGGGGGDGEGTNFSGGGGGSGFTPKAGASDNGDLTGGGAEVIDEATELDDVTVTQGNVSLLIPGRSMLDVLEATISTGTAAGTLPLGLTQIGNTIDIAMTEEHQALLNGPVSVTVTYDNAAVQDAENLLVLYTDGSIYEAATITGRNAASNSITFDTRRFSSFVLVETDGTEPSSYDTGFLPDINGWNIPAFGTFFAPGGTAFAMAGYAAWAFNQGTSLLSGEYSDEVAEILAARIQISQAETWGSQEWRRSQNFKDEELVTVLRTYLSALEQPLVMLLGENFTTHAVLVYGYDEDGFYFYDPAAPGDSQYIGYDGSNFGKYNGLSPTGYAALSSFGTDTDFSTLTAEADSGFPGSDNLSIDEPLADEAIDARETPLSGSFLNDLSEQTDLYVEVKGVGRQLPVTNGTFNNVIELSNGVNTIVALAGVDASLENNWFEDAPTLIRDVEGTLPPAHLLVTLTWEQNETDVDLYITEPEGETMWYGGSRTSNGLELDIDDTTGFGPEHGTLEVGPNSQVLEGEYIVRVHYFSDDGLGVDATGRVTIIINEGEIDQNTLSLRYRIVDDNSSESGPGSTGSSWVDIAKVDLINGTIDTNFDEGVFSAGSSNQ